jgi:hypothetical protein
MLTFIDQELAVFVVVEQDLLLVWSGHKGDHISQCLRDIIYTYFNEKGPLVERL